MIASMVRNKVLACIFAWATFVFLLVGCQRALIPAQRPTTTVVTFEARSIDFETSETRVPIRICDGMLLVEATVGKTTGPFMLDTGADRFIMSSRLASKEGMPSIETLSKLELNDMAGGVMPCTLTRVSKLTLGNAHLNGLYASVADLPGIQQVDDGKIMGVLGWPLFSSVLLTVDYGTNTATISNGELPLPDGKSILPLERDGFELFVSVVLNGRTLRLYPDTGSVSAVLTKDQAASVSWAGSTTFISRNAISKTNDRLGNVPGKCTIGGYEVASIQWAASNTRQFGILGQSILRQFKVTFDFKNMRMQLLPRSAMEVTVTGPATITGPASIHIGESSLELGDGGTITIDADERVTVQYSPDLPAAKEIRHN